MPFSRISVGECYSASELKTLSDILHHCLVETFAVPANDRFQVIERLPANQRIFDAHYQTGTRSERFISLHITAGKPRSREQKQAFYRTFSERLNHTLGISSDDVMVVIQFTQPEDWCFGRGEMYCPQ